MQPQNHTKLTYSLDVSEKQSLNSIFLPSHPQRKLELSVLKLRKGRHNLNQEKNQLENMQ